ncbi:MAG: peptidase M28 [Flavobacteriales bacterium]|nr:peptidase M28 [Flavobacteriales bacterium]
MKNSLTILILVFASNYLFSQTEKTTLIDQMKKDITFLASDKLKGRKTGTNGERKAAKYIKNEFEKYGLKEKGSKGYYQIFKTTQSLNPHSNNTTKKIKGMNVIGYCDNNQNETIIIGAHYDHLGYGHTGSLHTGEKAIHNGADDNASGVSVLLQLINELCPNKLYNYLFIAFSGEEEGLLGSSYFAKNPTIDLNTVRFMINFDMIGRLNQNNEIAINGTGTSTEWNNLLVNTNSLFNLKLIKSESGIGPSDHTSFYLQNIPVLHFFTGQHEDYHKPTDDVEKINFQGMYTIMSFVESLIKKSHTLDNFDFQETQSDTTKTPKFNVTLGIMPDYLYDGNGLRVDGVSKGKTASKFGILKNDIIIQMGNKEILNMMDYMKGLSQFKKGDSTIVKVKRKDEKIEIPIIFQ